jgi:hypothetical protein
MALVMYVTHEVVAPYVTVGASAILALSAGVLLYLGFGVGLSLRSAAGKRQKN